MRNVARVATVAVPVSDQGAALDFYVNALGLEQRADFAYADGERRVEVAPPGAATQIALARRMAGTVDVVGTTGLGAIAPNASVNFGISPSGAGFVGPLAGTLNVPTLFAANLTPGALTAIGRTPTTLTGLAVVPASSVQFGAASFTLGDAAGARLGAGDALTAAGGAATLVSVTLKPRPGGG